jgi:hypothetical protein
LRRHTGDYNRNEAVDAADYVVYWIALPAFVEAELVFAGITDNCGMGMLLMRMTQTNEDGMIKSLISFISCLGMNSIGIEGRRS